MEVLEMDVKMASGMVNTSTLVSTSSGNKVTLPVSPAMTPYAQYKYVRGVPAWNDRRAVPVTKLRVLNNIIDSLHSIKEQRNSLAVKPDETMSDQAIDALIEQYSSQLHQAIKQTAPVFGGEGAAVGMAFSLAV